MDSRVHHGVVATFDEPRGFGDVRRADNQHTYFFHCTQIADGSRTIGVGTEVTFRLAAGRLGRWEAMAVQPLDGVASTAAASPDGATFVCQVCDATVPGEVGRYEICARCGWEDDPAQRADPGYAGGANTMSLAGARTEWRRRQA